MQNDTLLAYLTAKITDKPENIATEALGFILKSDHARKSLQRLLAGFGFQNQAERYETQVQADDATRPDLVGFDSIGQEAVFIECKFWAGLTENQPVGYLKRLPKDCPALLLFVSPEKRIASLWDELIRRSKQAFEVKVVEGQRPDFRSLRIEDKHTLILISWRQLLGNLESDLEGAGKGAAASDVRQLHGLTERMDTEAFLPLRTDECAPELPRRLLHYSQLVNKAADLAIREGIFSNRDAKGAKLTIGSGQDYFGRYLGSGDTFGILMLDLLAWANMANYPIWFAFYGVDWDGKKYSKAFESLKNETPTRLFFAEGDSPYVPILLPCGVEEDAVVRSMVDQLKEIKQHLERWQATRPK